MGVSLKLDELCMLRTAFGAAFGYFNTSRLFRSLSRMHNIKLGVSHALAHKLAISESLRA